MLNSPPSHPLHLSLITLFGMNSSDDDLYVLEFMVGVEINMEINNYRKANKYKPFLHDLNPHSYKINFINTHIGTIGIHESNELTCII